ncbi:hypothetical protein GF366_01115 [Candidatus Peregrinibacteria bacterium]|nr:hypothetical protein [Candidatus Peregrinibacteria bacterium]
MNEGFQKLETEKEKHNRIYTEVLELERTLFGIIKESLIDDKIDRSNKISEQKVLKEIISILSFWFLFFQTVAKFLSAPDLNYMGIKCFKKLHIKSCESGKTYADTIIQTNDLETLYQKYCSALSAFAKLINYTAGIEDFICGKINRSKMSKLEQDSPFSDDIIEEIKHDTIQDIGSQDTLVFPDKNN